MTKVYFKAIDSYEKTDDINQAVVLLINKLIEDENLSLEKFIPLKVHCGEKGNLSFIEPQNFQGLITFLKNAGIDTAFIETNVLYTGHRNTSEEHHKTALEHGFTEIPFIIADGELGEEYQLVTINQKHFQTCKIAKGITQYNQVIVLSHFKGHIFAGFGGAIKQLAMGFASKGGKLAQHANSIPKISRFKCKSCKACVNKCPVKAVTIDTKAKIDKEKCIGCASCMGVCPYRAISNNWLASFSKAFNERLAEYAYAANRGKNHIFINFALNITKGCDCENHPMKPITADLGVFASTDPVAIDQACLDVLDKRAGKKVFPKGRTTLVYAEKIGVGQRKHQLIQLD